MFAVSSPIYFDNIWHEFGCLFVIVIGLFKYIVKFIRFTVIWWFNSIYIVMFVRDYEFFRVEELHVKWVNTLNDSGPTVNFDSLHSVTHAFQSHNIYGHAHHVDMQFQINWVIVMFTLCSTLFVVCFFFALHRIASHRMLFAVNSNHTFGMRVDYHDTNDSIFQMVWFVNVCSFFFPHRWWFLVVNSTRKSPMFFFYSFKLK